MSISKTDLEKIAKALRLALTIVEHELEPVHVSQDVLADVERKIAARICLAWDHEIPEGERVLRGLCVTDYNTTLARIRRGESDERELIAQGKILGERAKPGRRAASDVAQSEKSRVVADDLANYKKKQAGKKAKRDE